MKKYKLAFEGKSIISLWVGCFLNSILKLCNLDYRERKPSNKAWVSETTWNTHSPSVASRGMWWRCCLATFRNHSRCTWIRWPCTPSPGISGSANNKRHPANWNINPRSKCFRMIGTRFCWGKDISTHVWSGTRRLKVFEITKPGLPWRLTQ